MIAVDTSVWVDVLNDNDTPQAERCAQLIEAGEPVALTDVVFTEILQDLGSEREARLVERHLRAFPILRPDGPGLRPRGRALPRRAAGTSEDRQDARLPDRGPLCAHRGAAAAADADFDRLASCTSPRLYSPS